MLEPIPVQIHLTVPNPTRFSKSWPLASEHINRVSMLLVWREQCFCVELLLIHSVNVVRLMPESKPFSLFLNQIPVWQFWLVATSHHITALFTCVNDFWILCVCKWFLRVCVSSHFISQDSYSSKCLYQPPTPSPMSPSSASLSSCHGEDNDSISSPAWPKTPTSPVSATKHKKKSLLFILFFIFFSGFYGVNL